MRSKYFTIRQSIKNAELPFGTLFLLVTSTSKFIPRQPMTMPYLPFNTLGIDNEISHLQIENRH
jgi:hypothetical protein